MGKDAKQPALTMEQELEQAQAALTKANGELATARTELATANTNLTSARAEAAQLSKDKTEVQGKLDQSNKDLAARDQTIKDLQAKDQDLDKRAGIKAAEQLRKHGFKPVPEANEEAGTSAEELWTQYRALGNPKDQRAFYLKNKDKM